MNARTFSGALGITVLFALARTGGAGAGTVEGNIQVPPPPVPDAGADLYSKYNPSPTPRYPGTGAYAMVALRSSRGMPVRRSEEIPTMDQLGTRFVPRILPVQAGTEVRFLNSDPLFHNVFSLSPAKKFDLGRYPRGGSKLVKFDTPGVVQVFCDIHSQMVGFVVVTESPYFSLLDEAGAFEIPGVSPGAYEVVVWAEGMNRFEKVGEVEVPAEGTATMTAILSR